MSNNCKEESVDLCKDWSVKTNDKKWTTDFSTIDFNYKITGKYFSTYLLNIHVSIKFFLVVNVMYKSFKHFVFKRNASDDNKTSTKYNNIFECYQNDGTRY